MCDVCPRTVRDGAQRILVDRVVCPREDRAKKKTPRSMTQDKNLSSHPRA